MQDEIDQVLGQRPHAADEPATDALTPAPAGAMSFVIATVGRGPQVEALLNTIESARASHDEVILLIRADRAHTFTRCPPWLRVVTIPRLFASGRLAYSNEIFIDHVKPLSFFPAAILIFHNARAGAALQRDLGTSAHTVLREGWDVFVPRPGMLMRAVAARRHELPAGTRLRLHVLGFMHLVGNIAGVVFGGGISAHQVD